MKKISTILAILMIATGFSTAFQPPEPPINNTLIDEPTLPDTDFETSFEYGYESPMINFSSSENLDSDWSEVNNTEDREGGKNQTNETEEYPDNNGDVEEGSDSSDYSSSSGGSIDYVDVEVSDGVDNSTAATDGSGEQESDNQSENNQENGTDVSYREIFDAPWRETGSESNGVLEGITGQFSESNTVGGAFLLVFAGLAAFAYF